MVRTGLTLVLAALGLTILLFVATFVTDALHGFESLADSTAGQVLRFLMLASIAANLVSLGGRACCLVVPVQSRAREIIYGAVALDAVSAALNIASFLGGLPDALETLGSLASLAALVLFILFLLRLAVYLKLNEPGKMAEELLGWGVWLVIGYAVLVYVLPFLPLFGGFIGMFLSFGLLVMMIIMFVRYVELLWWLRSVID